MIFRPTSLLVRTNLTLAVSSLAIVAIVIFALQQNVVQPIAEQSADVEAALLVLTAQTWVELPPEARGPFEWELAENHDLYVSSKALEHPPASYDESPFLAALGGNFLAALEEKLTARLDQPVTLTQDDEGLVWATLPMGDHHLEIGFSGTRRDTQPLYSSLIIAVLGTAVVLLTSAIIVVRITRPLVQAAQRATEFRGAANFAPLPEKGPKELVVLAHNFNNMARDISALLANRTTLLGGISHDLKTPLTRMRLALELLPDSVDQELVARFERNLESMDELISNALKFARGAYVPAKQVDLPAFVQQVANNQDPPVPCACNSAPQGPVQLAPSALTRVLGNLISNAQQHGEDAAIRLNGREIHVLDNGPGIPEEHRDAIFQPFFRLDRSRSAVTGGSGLGLAIVHQLCQTHGWRIDVRDRSQGGADMCVKV